jgi:hypothetical protein
MSIRKLLGSVAIPLATLGLLAGPAWSARVVEVRVGSHPKFTRVVFELDAPAGYRIERRGAGEGQELVIVLDAASAPRKLSSRSPMVAGVELEASGTSSVARVRLRRSAPLVKELILAGPPRIVLDLVLPETTARETEKKPAAAAEAKPAPPPVAETRKIDSTAKPGVGAKPPSGEAPPVVAKPPAREAPPVVAKPPVREAPPVVMKPPSGEAPPVAARPDELEAKTARPLPPAPPTPGERAAKALEGERIVEPKPATAQREPEAERAAEAPPAALPAEPTAPAVKPPAPARPMPAVKPPAPARPMPAVKPPPVAPKAEPATGPFGLPLGGAPESWLTLGLVAAGALLFLAVVAMLLRRHSRPTPLDAFETGRQPLGPGESFETGERQGWGETAGGRPERGALPAAGPGLFEETEKGEGAMEMGAELPTEREPRGRMASAAVSADAIPGPVVRELERRMTELEARLDQVNEARERLERQVTAQSEELRVQRAAIARTQRALRGMSRGGEEQATEPALRDPSKPGSRP